MLNDHEQRVLRELEQQFLVEDPEFPRSFDTHARRLGRTRVATSTYLAIVVAVVLGVSMLAAGSLGGALATSVLTALVWLAWRRSVVPGGRPPEGGHVI
jgi:hypothetical protein